MTLDRQLATKIRPRASVRRAVASTLAEGPEAARDAVERALAGIDGPAQLVLGFSSGYDPSAAAAASARAAGGVPVVGMTTKGVLGPGGYASQGYSAIAFGAGFASGIGVVHSASDDLREAARRATADALEALGRAPGGHRLVLLFADPGSGDQSAAVSGAYESAGPSIPLIGGGAGGDGAAVPLAGGQAADNGFVAVALASERPIGVATAHGCSIDGLPSIVTRSNGPLVEEIDGRPAVEVYLEQIGYDGVTLSDPEFERLAVHHPLCQPELRGQGRLRHVRGRTDGGALLCATHIPADAAIEFASESKRGIVDSAPSAVRTAISAIGGEDPAAALVFDCAGRKAAINSELGCAVESLTAALPGRTRLAGGFTFGEIARTRGAKGDLNHAIAVAAFA